MDATFDRAALAHALDAAAAAVRPDGPDPADLARLVRLTAADNAGAAERTDRAAWSRAALPAEVAEPGGCLVRAAVLADLLRYAADGPVRVRAGRSGVTVAVAGGKAELAADARPFPDPPAVPGELAPAGDGFGRAVRLAAVAADKRDERYEGLVVEAGPRGAAVFGTDKYRMAAAGVVAKARPPAAIYLPARPVKAAAAAGGAVAVRVGGQAAELAAGGLTVTALAFHDPTDLRRKWRRIFDANATGHEAAVEAADLLRAVRLAGAAGDDPWAERAVTLSVGRGRATVEAEAADVGSGAADLPLLGPDPGAPLVAAVRAAHLADLLHAAGPGPVTLRWAADPRGVRVDGDGFRCLIQTITN